MSLVGYAKIRSKCARRERAMVALRHSFGRGSASLVILGAKKSPPPGTPVGTPLFDGRIRIGFVRDKLVDTDSDLVLPRVRMRFVNIDSSSHLIPVLHYDWVGDRRETRQSHKMARRLCPLATVAC